jgi:hypothetical protein
MQKFDAKNNYLLLILNGYRVKIDRNLNIQAFVCINTIIFSHFSLNQLHLDDCLYNYVEKRIITIRNRPNSSPGGVWCEE